MASKKTTKTAVPAADVEIIETSAAAEVTTVKEAPKKRDYKFPDHVMVSVQSNTFGELIYVNPHNGTKVSWSELGDVQPMPMGELRAMRNTQRGFFSNNRIFVLGIEEEGYEDALPEDVYKSLMVSQYYKDIIDPDNFHDLFRLDVNELRDRLYRLGDGAKTNVVVAANEAIKSGRLDSIRKIQVIEECLGCELIDIQ